MQRLRARAFGDSGSPAPRVIRDCAIRAATRAADPGRPSASRFLGRSDGHLESLDDEGKHDDPLDCPELLSAGGEPLAIETEAKDQLFRRWAGRQEFAYDGRSAGVLTTTLTRVIHCCSLICTSPEVKCHKSWELHRKSRTYGVTRQIFMRCGSDARGRERPARAASARRGKGNECRCPDSGDIRIVI